LSGLEKFNFELKPKKKNCKYLRDAHKYISYRGGTLNISPYFKEAKPQNYGLFSEGVFSEP